MDPPCEEPHPAADLVARWRERAAAAARPATTSNGSAAPPANRTPNGNQRDVVFDLLADPDGICAGVSVLTRRDAITRGRGENHLYLTAAVDPLNSEALPRVPAAPADIAVAERLHRSTGELTAWEIAHPAEPATAGQAVSR